MPPSDRTAGAAQGRHVDGFLLFALAVFVLEQLPAGLGRAGTWVDLVTPFVVLAAAAIVLARQRRDVLLLALVAAIAYVDGHGIHLAANDIGHYETVAGHAEEVRHFWDEFFGHLEWHLGFFGLLAAFALADDRRAGRGLGWPAVGLLGWTMLVTSVEGGDWWLPVAFAAPFAGLAVANRRRTAALCAAATVLATALIGVWALWHGGVPEFSELGWL